MENWLIPSVIAIVAVIVAVVDCIGTDHLHKRSILVRLTIYTFVGVLAFASGWLSNRQYHRRNLEAEKAPANKAIQTQPTDAEIFHVDKPRNPPPAEQSPPIPSTPTSDPKTHKHPTPESIIKIINDAIPLARPETESRFVGVSISWDGRLDGVFEALGPKAQLYIDVVPDDPKPSATVRIPIDLSKHDFLRKSPKGTHLHVEGVISSAIANGTILLKDVTVLELKND